MASYDGTEGDDIYIGHDPVRYFITTNGGNDTVETGDLADVVYGGEGHNHITTGKGDDVLWAGHGDDWLSAGEGDDTIMDNGATVLGIQHLFGGKGNDTIVLKGGGKSYLYGGQGDDTYVLWRAGDINEIQYGVPNADIAEDTYGGGHDTIILSSGWAGFVMAANVEDLIASNDNAYVDRMGLFNVPDDTVLGVEVTGNASHNFIKGTIVRDILHGGIGNDTLDAYFGDGDRLYGGEGHDTLILGGAVNTKLQGGKGNDVYKITAWGDGLDSVVEKAGEGDDRIELASANVDMNRASLKNIEFLTFTVGNADTTYTVTGNTLNNVLITSDGKDVVYGRGGHDRIISGNGADKLYGDEGNDSLYGGAGNDHLYGGTGNDLIDSGSGTGDWASGGEGNDSIHGLDGNDWFYGDAGDDSLVGNGGQDKLEGGAGNDSLYGGAGNDVLVGGAGIDRLEAGLGADRFVFKATSDSTASAADKIVSFESGLDKIDLSAIDAGRQPVFRLLRGRSARVHHGRVGLGGNQRDRSDCVCRREWRRPGGHADQRVRRDGPVGVILHPLTPHWHNRPATPRCGGPVPALAP